MNETDIIGGFPEAEPNCKGCGKPLLIENAWMTDGCPCNHPLGINSMNETRWRLLMMLQQREHSLCTTMGLAAEQSHKAKATENRAGSLLLQEQLHAAWKYATRAVNVCESMGLSDTREALAAITVLLSQQLEFVETKVQAE